jgi:hypothetical protein
MSQIFIANPTLQHRQLHVRMTEKQTRIVQIPAYGQTHFPDDLEEPMLGKVLKQVQAAGGVPSNDPKAITKRFSLIYTVSPKPIAEEKIVAATKADQAVRQELASVEIERSGAAAFDGAKKVGAREVTLEVTQVQDDNVEVKGGVDVSVTVGTKKHVRGGRESTRKK